MSFPDMWQKSFVFLITCEVGHESKRCHLGSFFLDVALKSWPGGGAGWSRHIKLIYFFKNLQQESLILFVSASMNGQSLQILGTAWWPNSVPSV